MIVDQSQITPGAPTLGWESGVVSSPLVPSDEGSVLRERRGDRIRGPPLVLTYSELGGVPVNIPLVDNTAEIDVIGLARVERSSPHPPSGAARKYPPRPRPSPSPSLAFS